MKVNYTHNEYIIAWYIIQLLVRTHWAFTRNNVHAPPVNRNIFCAYLACAADRASNSEITRGNAFINFFASGFCFVAPSESRDSNELAIIFGVTFLLDKSRLIDIVLLSRLADDALRLAGRFDMMVK